MAQLHILVRLADNTIIDRRDFAAAPPDVTRKGIQWRPVVEIKPDVNEATQVREGPVETLHPDRFERVWTVRAKTVQELDEDKEQALSNFMLVGLRVLFDHENRIRTLAGQPTVTMNQFRNALKAAL